MHIEHKINHAVAGASFCVRSSVGSLVVCCGLLGASAASAAPGEPQRDEMRGQPARELLRSERMPPQQSQPRQFDPRSFEGRAEEQRRAVQVQENRGGERHPGRLTPDERRDLRRQINEVGQDIYANPPRR